MTAHRIDGNEEVISSASWWPISSRWLNLISCYLSRSSGHISLRFITAGDHSSAALFVAIWTNWQILFVHPNALSRLNFWLIYLSIHQFLFPLFWFAWRWRRSDGWLNRRQLRPVPSSWNILFSADPIALIQSPDASKKKNRAPASGQFFLWKGSN